MVSSNNTVVFQSGAMKGGFVKVIMKKEVSGRAVMTRLMIEACVVQADGPQHSTSAAATGGYRAS